MDYLIDTIQSAENLVSVCRSFKDDVDVIYGRQVIDGKSLLGVVSLMGAYGKVKYYHR